MGNHGKKAYVNGAIIAVNIIYFLFLEITGSSLNTGFMVKRGAMYALLYCSTVSITDCSLLFSCILELDI